ncbi:MAG: PhzF family phenazine biosynthesis protein [Pedobacter sp.]
MELDLYQIDAFAEKVFEGNPAAVCPLEAWLPDRLMQAIAAENNLSETAFFVKTGSGYHIRWFTPSAEVDLCGHATLASAFVLFHCLRYDRDAIHFESKSGPLVVRRDGDLLEMDFPSQPPQTCEVPGAIYKAFGVMPVACLKSEDYLVILEDEKAVATADPDMSMLKELDLRGVIITARSDRYDFVARFFAPRVGVNEDPVTGSAYTQLVPYWAKMLGKNRFKARQISQRGGDVHCFLSGDRVIISGKAVKYMVGRIDV